MEKNMRAKQQKYFFRIIVKSKISKIDFDSNFIFNIIDFAIIKFNKDDSTEDIQSVQEFKIFAATNF
jgi:hypothetical protein